MPVVFGERFNADLAVLIIKCPIPRKAAMNEVLMPFLINTDRKPIVP